jgi:hypothetical protein
MMTAEERFERIEANLEKLAMLATSTAASVIAHDEQSLRAELAQLHREFQRPRAFSHRQAARRVGALVDGKFRCNVLPVTYSQAKLP